MKTQKKENLNRKQWRREANRFFRAADEPDEKKKWNRNNNQLSVIRTMSELKIDRFKY